jgi:tape measure domain-containing protein
MAAQDAELKLRVSLDLGFFRQQLAGLGQAAAGYNLPLQVKFDRKGVQRELRNLDRAIGKKTINVALNLAGGLTKDEFGKIKRRLDDLRELRKVEIPISVKNGATGKDINDTITAIKGRIAASQQIKQGGGKLRIATSIKPSITNADVADFKRAIKDKFAGIRVKVNAELGGIGGGKTQAQIERDAMAGWQRVQQMGRERMGGVSEAARRESLKQSLSGRNIGELKDIGSQLGVGGVGRFKNTQNLIQKIVTEASVEMITKYLDPQAVMRNPDRSGLNKVLDTFARGLFGMLGMDVASMRQQMVERRALPGINFPATVPSRSVSIGPSSTGRALPPGATREALPGTAFGSQRYLPTALGDEMKRVLREAANAFLDTIRAEFRKVNKRDIGAAVSRQPLLGPGSIAGMLPAAVGREPSRYAMGGESREQMMARREREARMRSDLRGMDVMGGGAGRPPSPYSYAYRSARPTGAIVPYATPGAIVPQPRAAGEQLRGQATPFASPLPKNYLEIGKIIKGIDPILQRSSVPFSGAIRELGGEFGFAIKQVLLFGTAYKALAFFMDLPAQALRASTALQSFNNQLNAIAGGAPQAARSMEFINATVERFNIPLQSAREGFLRLYASMSPAGMNAGMIENLFVGISQASATLGLSADQVDRVTYAFSQMASKGKVMSEEVTGQLGDVIPGALSLMSDAAGMSMAEFKQAMEDGLVSGKAMEQLFTNLPIVLEQRFGKGAAGAAQTLQGQLNDLATSTTRLYEAFEPIVNSIAGVVLPALSAGLADAESAVAAFGMKIEGINPATNLLSENAKNIYRNLGIAADTASSLISIIQSLGGIFNMLGSILSGTLQLFNAIVGNPVGEFFVKLAVNIGLATAAINLLIAQGILRAIANFALMVGNIQLTIGALRTLITTSRAAKIAMGGIVAGSIMVGLEMLVTHISKVREETEKLQKAALATADALKQMSYQQLVAEERSAQSRISKLEQLQAAGGGGLRVARPTKEQEAMARELGLPISGRGGQRAIDLTRAEGLRQQLLEQLPQIRGEMKGRFDGPATATTITPIDLTAGEADSKTKGQGARKSLDQLVNAEILKLTELEKANIKLAKARTEAMAPDTAQAERMLDYYVKFRNNLVDIQAIQAQLQIIENNRAQYIQLGFTQIEIDERAAELRNQLAIATVDLSTTEQEYRNRAKEDAADEAQEMEKRIDQQRELNRLIEDAAIASGAISQRQAGVIQQRRGFEDQLSRAQGLGATPEQIVSLQQLQASMPEAGSLQEKIQALRQEFEQLANWEYQAAKGAMAVGQALGEAMTTGVASLISGTASAKEVFASFLQSIGQALSQAASQMIATYIAIGIAKLFAGLGGGGGGGGVDTNAFNQGGIPGLSNTASIGTPGTAVGFGFANGGIAPGGFQAFANGGVVSGPTLGLVGEGKYNEAIVPLPDGKSIPVQLGGRSARDLMGGGAPGMPQASTLNMKFETTKINGVEYVSREQLEVAMAETRRASISGGARQGMSMTLDKIKQSPSTRSSIGIR